MNKKTIYLDYAAATPLNPMAKKAMEPFFSTVYGNSSSLHHKGLEAKTALELARTNIARVLNARPQEIIFTSGGTESCNLAVKGVLDSRGEGHAIATAIEHHAVIEPLRQLEKKGLRVTFLKVDSEGFVRLKDIESAVTKQTALISVIFANNEIGTIQRIADISNLVLSLNIKRKKKNLPKIFLHTDACQAPGFLDINVQKLGIDLMSLAASKFYGPKGAGILYVRQGVKLNPIISGGGQEAGLRSGTENVAAIVGMAKALEIAHAEREKEGRRLSKLRDKLIASILKNVKGAKLNGPKGDKRLANNLNFSFQGVEGEALMLYLDAQGICVSTASACSTGTTERSHVIKSIGVGEEQAKGTIRITLGKYTSLTEINFVTKTLKLLIEKLRKFKTNL